MTCSLKMCLVSVVAVVFITCLWNFYWVATVDGVGRGVRQPPKFDSGNRPTFKVLEDQNLLSIISEPNDGYFDRVLREILIPRVPGTQGQTKVKNFIVSELQKLDWVVQEDAFMANTPHGSKPFYNVIGTLNPNACKRLVLSCHFDSKFSRSGKFVGAIDSAVPCSMMLQIIKDLDPLLKAQRSRSNNQETTLQLMFFDGEEAFEQWSSTDSLYGSRHLADRLSRTMEPPNGPCGGRKDVVSELDRIDVLILLDLIGTAKPSFYSFFPETDFLYAQMLKIEQRLNQLKQTSTSTSYFKNRRSLGFVEDDHIPFYRRGVKILHVIPSPFPSVWHKDSDNESALHSPTIKNLVKMFKVLVSEYLGLET